MDDQGITGTGGDRAIILLVPQASIMEYLTGKRALSNVPEGACVRSMWIDRWGWVPGPNMILAMRLEHASFPRVPSGRRLPRIKARFRRLSQ